MSDKKIYKCSVCDFEWQNKGKNYDNCPDCGSEEIFLAEEDDIPPKTTPQTGVNNRRSLGGKGRGAGPPRVCKCTKCGYETPKTRGVPCRNYRCPECGAPLCGAD